MLHFGLSNSPLFFSFLFLFHRIRRRRSRSRSRAGPNAYTNIAFRDPSQEEETSYVDDTMDGMDDFRAVDMQSLWNNLTQSLCQLSSLVLWSLFILMKPPDVLQNGLFYKTKSAESRVRQSQVCFLTHYPFLCLKSLKTNWWMVECWCFFNMFK